MDDFFCFVDLSTKQIVQFLDNYENENGALMEDDENSPEDEGNNPNFFDLGKFNQADLYRQCTGGIHDEPSIMAKCLIQRLMPILLMRSDETAATNSTNIPAKIVNLKEKAEKYVINLLNDQKNTISPFVYILLQNLCAKIVDKAAYRSKCATTVVDLLTILPEEYFCKFVDWLCKFSRHTKISCRTFAVDVASTLTKKIAFVDENETLKRDLVALVVHRCSDRAAGVRIRALNAVSSLIGDSDRLQLNLLVSIVAAATPNRRTTDEQRRDSAQDVSFGRGSLRPIVVRQSDNVSLMEKTSFVPLILRRCSDEKAMVRKMAVQTLETILSALPETLTEETLEMLHKCSLDPALSVRKQAVESFTKILVHYDDEGGENLETKWLSSILPTVTDAEVSVQEKSSELFASIVFDNLTTTSANDAENRKAWRLLSKIEKEKEFTRYLRRLLQKLVKSRSLNGRAITSIEIRTKQTDSSAAAWMLLAECSAFVDFSPTYAKNAWLAENFLNGNVINYVAKILSNKVDRLERTDAEILLVDMKRKIESFDVFPEHIGSILHAISNLYRRTSTSTSFQTWCSQLATVCERYLSDVVFTDHDDDDYYLVDSIALIRRLITLGEIVQLSSTTITNKRIFFILQALTVSTHEMMDEIFTQPTQPQRQRKEPLPEDVRAFALIGLGKLCLQDEESAKKCVASMARELETCESSRIRNNIIVVLADLCVRYTSLVDRHMSTISKCLRDRSVLVRKQTLTLLTTLLKEDYLKWRGVLFHRFLGSLLDRDVDIRQFTEFCLKNILLVRHPMMFFNHFVECLFVFNDLKYTTSCGAASGDDADVVQDVGVGFERFKLSGAENQARRMFLYTFMLQRFNDQQRFQTSARICQDILGNVVDELMPLDASTEEVIRDALNVLACKEMKLCSLRRPAAADDIDVDDPEPAGLNEMIEFARKTLSQAVKQSTIENIVPTVVSLKQMLARNRHPLLRELMIYLRELVKDYKTEIREIFAADHQLAVEIEYDLKRFENRPRNK